MINRYADVIGSYYKITRKERIKILLKAILVGSFLAVFPAFLLYVMFHQLISNDIFLILFKVYFSFTVIITLVSIYFNLKREMYYLNEIIIENILSFITNEKVTYEPDTQISMDSVDKMDLFNFDTAKYEGKNCVNF